MTSARPHDACPNCRGVWLDRGELDKILQRAGDDAASPQAEAGEPVKYVHREPWMDQRKRWLRALFD